jgi:hypothetical protein
MGCQDGMVVTLSADDVFHAYDPTLGVTFDFPNCDGFHFYKDVSACSDSIGSSVDTFPLQQPPTLSYNLAVNNLSRTRSTYEFLLVHQRLNHMNFQMLKNLISQGKIKGFRGNISLVDVALLRKCKMCGIWKMKATPQLSMNPSVRDHRPGARFDCDFKTFSITFVGNLNTVVVFVDAYSKKSYSYWLHYPTKSTPDLFLNKVFKLFYAEVCLPNKWPHFIFHPDNAKTFLSGAMLAFCNEHLIIVDPSVKYKSSTNGTAESTIRDLTIASMCNFGSTSLHKSLFNLCWNYTEDVANSVPTPPSYLSPNFLTDGSETNVDDHRSFGARCYLLNHSTVKPTTNVEAPGHEAIWLGYGDHRTSHMLLDVKTNVVSKFPHGNVVLDEFNTEAHYNDTDVNEQLEFLNEIDDAITQVNDLAATALPPSSPVLSTVPPSTCSALSDPSFLSDFYASTLSSQVSVKTDTR